MTVEHGAFAIVVAVVHEVFAVIIAVLTLVPGGEDAFVVLILPQRGEVIVVVV